MAAADGEGQAEGSGKAEGSVEGPTETNAAGIAQAGHAETDAVDPSMSSAADHSAGPTGMNPLRLVSARSHPYLPSTHQFIVHVVWVTLALAGLWEFQMWS